MTAAPSRSLAIARPAIVVLMVLNGLYALIIFGLLVWSFFIEGWPTRPLGIELTTAYPMADEALRGIVVLGMIAAAIVHTVLRRLLAIVDTVRTGDPFIAGNAERLTQIAWRVMALEILRLVIGTIVRLIGEPFPADPFSLTPWLAILLLFVLAGVFARGARMRADLEGTV